MTGLREPSPVPEFADARDSSLANSKLCSKLFQGLACGVANLPDLFFRQLGPCTTFATLRRPVSQLVLTVLSLCAPSQVLGSVVGPVVVEVPDHSAGRTWTVERNADTGRALDAHAVSVVVHQNVFGVPVSTLATDELSALLSAKADDGSIFAEEVLREAGECSCLHAYRVACVQDAGNLSGDTP